MLPVLSFAALLSSLSTYIGMRTRDPPAVAAIPRRDADPHALLAAASHAEPLSSRALKTLVEGGCASVRELAQAIGTREGQEALVDALGEEGHAVLGFWTGASAKGAS